MTALKIVALIGCAVSGYMIGSLCAQHSTYDIFAWFFVALIANGVWVHICEVERDRQRALR